MLARRLADTLSLEPLRPVSETLRSVLGETPARDDYLDVIKNVAGVMGLARAVPQAQRTEPGLAWACGRVASCACGALFCTNHQAPAAAISRQQAKPKAMRRTSGFGEFFLLEVGIADQRSISRRGAASVSPLGMSNRVAGGRSGG